MNKRFRIHAIFILIALGVVFVGGLLFLHFRSSNPTTGAPAISDDQIYNKTLMAGAVPIAINVANTDQSREQGLSGTPSLPANSGKLFVFQTPGSYGFWMKDMNYPLDFVWINTNMKIVAITPNVATTTYPQIFYPPSPVLDVLEVNAGFSAKNNLAVGQQLSLQ